MALTKQKKIEILEKLKKIVKDSISVVFVNFHGLSVSDSSSVRKDLRGKGVGFTVAKKTLTRKAFEGEKLNGNMPELPGELGIIFGKDSIEPARGVYEFQKKFDNRIQIVGGVFEGKFVGKEEMVSIAQIPDLKTLHAQFVNLINSPIQGFVMAINEIAKSKNQ